jgi:hypothetical protein
MSVQHCWIGGEHRQPAEDHALLDVQQVVRPAHRRVQRAMTRLTAAPGGGEQPEPLIQSTRDVGHRQGAHLRRRELQGEGEAVEAPADLDHGGEVPVVQREALVHAGSLDEQPYGVVLERVVEPDRVAGHAEGTHDAHQLTGHAQGFTRRREHRGLGADREHVADELGDVLDHVLAVVEHEQQAALGEVAAQRDPVRARQPHGRSNRMKDVVGASARERDEAAAVGEGLQHLRR